MKNAEKYKRQYFLPENYTCDWVKKEYIDRAPIWCSVDLRDGNQALTIPMDIERKLEFFQTLVKTGFKEIEAGFPAASDTEFLFLRRLIEGEAVPKDVTLQVLTQSREHIIGRTFQAVEGCDRAIIHLYNSISRAQREQVFKMSKEEIMDIAVRGARSILDYSRKCKGDFVFEYSPESFTGTEPEFALQVINAVLDIWKPEKKGDVIINIPATVELSLPHIFASQIEFIHKNMKYRDKVILSVHTHNDRGCAVADTELALLAGAERVEGTLFGNGERTGNADLVNIAMNLYMHGIDPGLDFTDMPLLVKTYEKATGMNVDARSPYSGDLVFAAFSGSHQDAIAKSMKYMEEKKSKIWSVPYLTIDPGDINREYETEVIRINSQSGKGGVNYILEHNFGLKLPKDMGKQMAFLTKERSDALRKELSPVEIFELFKESFENINDPLSLTDVKFINDDGISAKVTAIYRGEKKTVTASGNGSLNAVSVAIRKAFGFKYSLATYEEHALEKSSSSRAMAYVGIKDEEGEVHFGAGLDTDIIIASIGALTAAINNMLKNRT